MFLSLVTLECTHVDIAMSVIGEGGGVYSPRVLRLQAHSATHARHLGLSAGSRPTRRCPFDGYGLGLFNFESDWGLAGVGHAGANFGFVSWAACVSGDRPVVVVVLVNRRGDSFGLPRPLVMAALSD